MDEVDPVKNWPLGTKLLASFIGALVYTTIVMVVLLLFTAVVTGLIISPGGMDSLAVFWKTVTPILLALALGILVLITIANMVRMCVWGVMPIAIPLIQPIIEPKKNRK